MVGDWENAERELERAIELNPGYAIAHMWRAFVLSSTGRADEAVGPAQRALELDPVSRVISLVSGEVFLLGGRMEEAIEQLRETIGLAPEWSNAWFALGHALLIEGRYDEGLEAWLNSARLENLDVAIPTATYQAMVRYRETGKPQTFPDHDRNPRTQIVMYAESGQPDRAIELFEVFVRSGAYGWAGHAHSLPTGDLLGGDPRYQALLEEAGITW
jgi:tetratricopeptide (TPR) repeat protein